MYSSVPYIYWQGRNKNVYIHDKVTKIRYNKNIKLGLYLSIANILYFILILSYYKFI